MSDGPLTKPLPGSGRLERFQRRMVARQQVKKLERTLRREKADAMAVLRETVWMRDKGQCRACGMFLRLEAGFFDSMHLHHIEHRSQGGKDTTDNTMAACEPDHTAHHDKGTLSIKGHGDGLIAFVITDNKGIVIRSWESEA